MEVNKVAEKMGNLEWREKNSEVRERGQKIGSSKVP